MAETCSPKRLVVLGSVWLRSRTPSTSLLSQSGGRLSIARVRSQDSDSTRLDLRSLASPLFMSLKDTNFWRWAEAMSSPVRSISSNDLSVRSMVRLRPLYSSTSASICTA